MNKIIYLKDSRQILNEVDQNMIQFYTKTEKEQALDVLNKSRMLCLEILADGDTMKCLRLEISSNHQRICRAIEKIEQYAPQTPAERYHQQIPIIEPEPQIKNYNWQDIVVGGLLLFIVALLMVIM